MFDKKSFTNRERESSNSQARSIILYLAVAMIASGFVMSLVRSVALDVIKFSYAYSKTLEQNRSKNTPIIVVDKSESAIDGVFLKKKLSETVSNLREFGSNLYAHRDKKLDTMVVHSDRAEAPTPIKTPTTPLPPQVVHTIVPEIGADKIGSSNSAILKPSENVATSSVKYATQSPTKLPSLTPSTNAQIAKNPTVTAMKENTLESNNTKKSENIQASFVDSVTRVCSYQPKKYQAKGWIDMPTGRIANLKITWQVFTTGSKQSILNVVDYGLVKSGDPFNTEIPWPGIKPQDKKVQVSLTAQLYDRKTAQILLKKPAEANYVWESSSSCPPPNEAKPDITHQLSITNVSKDMSIPNAYIISYRGFIKNIGNVAIDDLKSTQIVRNVDAVFVSALKTDGLDALHQNKALFTLEPLQQGQVWGYVTAVRVVAKDLGIVCSELESEAMFDGKSITAPKSRSCFDLAEKYNKKRYIFVKPTLFCPSNTTKIQRDVNATFVDTKEKQLQAIFETATGYYRVDLEEGIEAKVKAQIGTVDLTLANDSTQLAKSFKYDVNKNVFEVSFSSTDKGICAPEINASSSASTNSRLKLLPTVTPTPTPLPTGTQLYIGGRIWSDNNKNGLQDDGEEAVTSVYTQLFNCTDSLVALKTIRTNNDGNYKYENLQPGCFKARVFAPAGYTLCTNKAAESGSKPTKDSDVYVTGESDAIVLTPTNLTSIVDACLIKGVLTTDLSLSMNANNLRPQLWENVTHIITVTNEGTYDVTGTKIKLHIPSGLLYVSHEITGDVVEAYNQYDGLWNTGTVEAGQSKILKLVLNVISSSNISSVAEISQMTGTDVDSTPNNQITTEDDYGSVSLTLAGQVQGISDVRQNVEKEWTDMSSLIAISAFIGLCMGAVAIEESRLHSYRESHKSGNLE